MEKYKYKRYGDELRFNYCPICKKERAGNPDFTINILKGVYFCHSTGESGTLEQLKKDYDFDFNLRDIHPQEKEHKPKKILIKYLSNMQINISIQNGWNI